MIPLKLEITNFLSYRETAVLDFRGLHLACISGENGAGKSSILDAMTWVLFGQSRSKSDDDLVNRTAAQNDDWAEVQFKFDLEGAIYRITRRRRARKSTVLELQIASAFDGDEVTDWKTLSESKIKETQAVIEDILHMNFDSFINASFFLQGKADEFTTKTPARRKEILAELLGINVWDSYREKVAVRRKAQEDQIRLQEARIAEIDEELTEEPARKAKVEEMEQKYALIQEQLSAKELILTDLRKIETAVTQQKQQLNNLRNNLTRTEETIANLTQSKAQRQAEVDKHQLLLDQAKTIEANFKKWQGLDTAVNAWQEKANRHNQFNRQMEPLRLTIAETRSRLEQQLKQLELSAAQAKQANENAQALQPQIDEDRTALTAIDKQLKTFDAQSEELKARQGELQKIENERALWQQERNQLQKEASRIANLEKEQTTQTAQVEQIHSNLERVTVQLTTFSEQIQQKATLEGELSAMDSEQPQLKAEMDELKAKMDQLSDATSAVCPLCGQALSAEHREQVLADLKDSGKQRGDRYRNNQVKMKSHQETLSQITVALKEQPALERQQTSQRELLARAEAKIAECAGAIAEWQENGRLRLTKLEEMLAEQANLVTLKEEVARLETAVAEKSSLDNKRQTLQERIAQNSARHQTLQAQIERWSAEGPTNLADTKAMLENNSYATDEQTQLATLQAEQTAVEYDEYEHQQAIQARSELQDAPEQHRALEQAASGQKSVLTFIDTLNEQIAAQEAVLADQTTQVEQAEAALESLQTSDFDLLTVEKEVNALREEAIQANRNLGAARQSLDVLGDLQKRRKKLTVEKTEMSNQLHRLKQLEEACGRDGVQALLIEAAAPEIEDRANELLARLTGNRMSVRFETQKTLKSQKSVTRETLDIHIRDEAGERPYSNFSGGEQFRVNFAIRLALSQILARRAGAKLQTLVIDEGFGSQDPNGRQRLIEAINTIQDDFERILVITHIEELREAFPNQIMVEKGTSGSQFTIR